MLVHAPSRRQRLQNGNWAPDNLVHVVPSRAIELTMQQVGSRSL